MNADKTNSKLLVLSAFIGVYRRLFRFENADFAQIPVFFVVVESVPNHEFVGNPEPDVRHVNGTQTPLRLVEKRGYFYGFGLALPEQSGEVVERHAAVDDVFDDQYVGA